MVKALLAYQEMDAKLRKIEVELASSPARKKMVSAKNFIDNTPDGVNKLDDKALSLSVQYENLIQDQKKITEQQAELAKAIEFAEEQTEIKYLIKKADELLSQIKQISANISKVNEELQKVMKEYNTLRVQNKSAQTKQPADLLPRLQPGSVLRRRKHQTYHKHNWTVLLPEAYTQVYSFPPESPDPISVH